MVDNIDSFVWNLVRYFQLAGASVEVCRNDRLDLDRIGEKIRRNEYLGITLSPGPGTPDEASGLLPLIHRFMGQLPMLGICLGHQALAQACGARIFQTGQPMHGKLSLVHHNGQGLFTGLPDPLTVTRYHSLAVAPDSLPASLAVSAWTDDGTIMGLQHASGLLEGVQFHPEAELTEHGLAMIQQFVGFCSNRAAIPAQSRLPASFVEG
jgi:anthranilate synthase/aminodeoxychorismate synthase-like glutamine amidotransferase